MNLPISIRGARQHNLQNLNLDLPSGKLIAFSGPSGSGKSSLAFDTLFAESRRRFLDCLSARARQGIEQPDKPDVDSITGLPPALSLEQSARHQHPRTLLGSITEILDYLRILYAAAGRPHDPETGKELVRQTPDQIADALASLPEQTRLVLTAPAEALLAQDPAATLGDFQRQGFLRIYWNGEVRDIEELGVPDAPAPDAALVIDRIIIRGESSSSRLADSLQTALRINPDEVRAVITRPEEEPAVQAFHTRYRNPETGYLLPQLTPRHFSFNSPLGACPACHGTGLNKQENGPCPECRGQRLSPLALAVTMHTPDHAYNLAELTALPLEDMVGETKRLEIPAALAPALNPVMEEINKRTHFLNELGLSYLSLDRQANTLSGGELQRARLASQLGAASPASCTSWTNPRRGCTLPTRTACCGRSKRCATWAIRCLPWSTTNKFCARRTTWWTWARAPEPEAAISWRRVPFRTSWQTPRAPPGHGFPERGKCQHHHAGQPPAASSF